MILEELQSFENASGEQNRKRKKILHELIKARKNHPVLLEVKEKRDKVSLAIIQIANKSGDFTFMQDDRYYNRDVDTINVEVIAIEEDLKSFRDSLQNRYNRLKVIIEDSTNSRATHHKAAQLLGTSNYLEDIKFIFDKHTELTFGLIEPDVPATETWGAERSAMANLSWHHIPHHPAEKSEKNWIVFPFLIEYWGDSQWSKELENTWSKYLLEFVLFQKLTRGYEKPWLLVEFIKANVSNPDTETMKFIEERFGRKAQEE